MLKRNTDDALAIIFTNSYDTLLPDLVAERSSASIPFAGRYRLCDFLISSLVQSNISNISLMCRQNYHSLMDHLGSGQEFDLARKNGGLNIVPPFAERQMNVYNGRVEALESIRGYLQKCTEKYVILCDANYAINFDFRKLIHAHKSSGADVTMMYRKAEIPQAFFRPINKNQVYYTLNIDNDRVTRILVNSKERGKVNYSMNCSIVERNRLIDLVEDAYVHGKTFFSRDVLSPNIGIMNIRAFEYTGYCAQVMDNKTYFQENMALLDDANCEALFSGNTIYTKVRDDNPTRYMKGAVVKNAMVADGCIIEGEVENCVIFRGVHIAKGAKVKNCVLMQDTSVDENADIEYVITDKNVTITSGKILSGNDSYQVFVSKGQTV